VDLVAAGIHILHRLPDAAQEELRKIIDEGLFK
jgi:hypothetical protein